MKKIRSPRKSKFLCAALMATIVIPVVGAATEVSAYRMAVVSDASQGRTILYGSYEKAIDKLAMKKARSHNRFSTYNNLCVAYTKTKNLEKAVQACDAAIAHTAVRRDLAVALSNRGVLFAVSGNTEKARQSFEEALELNAYDKDPGINLSLLNSMAEPTMASEY